MNYPKSDDPQLVASKTDKVVSTQVVQETAETTSKETLPSTNDKGNGWIAVFFLILCYDKQVIAKVIY